MDNEKDSSSGGFVNESRIQKNKRHSQRGRRRRGKER
jgi:hypothetical protein